MADLAQKLRRLADQVDAMTPEQQDAAAQSVTMLGPFICGHGGEKDENGLPEIVTVCPYMGATVTAFYRKVEE